MSSSSMSYFEVLNFDILDFEVLNFDVLTSMSYFEVLNFAGLDFDVPSFGIPNFNVFDPYDLDFDIQIFFFFSNFDLALIWLNSNK